MSRNLVKTIRRHHEQGAPTALDVLKEARDARGVITDDDRRVAAERSGLPEAAVHGISTFYDDLLAPRGTRHVRVCNEDGAVSLAETVCLGYWHASPAVRDDAARLWIEDGEAISVRSRHGSIEIIAEVTDRIERGHVFTTFHFAETRTNLLIAQSADDNTSCPDYKVVAVDARPIGEQSTMTPALAGAAGS